MGTCLLLTLNVCTMFHYFSQSTGCNTAPHSCKITDSSCTNKPCWDDLGRGGQREVASSRKQLTFTFISPKKKDSKFENVPVANFLLSDQKLARHNGALWWLETLITLTQVGNYSDKRRSFFFFFLFFLKRWSCCNIYSPVGGSIASADTSVAAEDRGAWVLRLQVKTKQNISWFWNTNFKVFWNDRIYLQYNVLQQHIVAVVAFSL